MDTLLGVVTGIQDREAAAVDGLIRKIQAVSQITEVYQEPRPVMQGIGGDML
jgi:hypothetical protein